MFASTQDHLLVKDVKDDLIILKDGGLAAVLQTSAVNFDLLSDQEQVAIISSFAGLLNSLSFMVQIVIRSKRLDISTYLQKLTHLEQKQTNSLLKNLMIRYRQFVTQVIQENEVLDKQFYVVVPISYLELGVIGSAEKNLDKAKTILLPRIDHLIRQFNRIGLKISVLNSEKLVRLLYDFYNESEQDKFLQVTEEMALTQAAVKKQENSVLENPPQVKPSIPTVPTPQIRLPVVEHKEVFLSPPIINPVKDLPQNKAVNKTMIVNQQPSYNTPFVVEELPDDYTTG